MPLTTGLEAALDGSSLILCTLVKITLPGPVTLALVDGSYVVDWGGDAYVGRDPDLGALVAVGEIADGVTTEAGRWSVTLDPADDAALAQLLSKANQGSLVQGWEAVIDPTTGLLYDDPDPLFVGYVDIPSLSFDGGAATVSFDCYAALEKFFAQNEGARMTWAHHQRSWSTELGFSLIAVDFKGVWGLRTPGAVHTKS